MGRMFECESCGNLITTFREQPSRCGCGNKKVWKTITLNSVEPTSSEIKSQK